MSRWVCLGAVSVLVLFAGRELGATPVGAVRDMAHLRLALNVEPVKGEAAVFQVTLELRAKEAWSSAGLRIRLPNGAKADAAEPAWSGKLSPGEAGKAVARVTVPGPGLYRIQGDGSTSRPMRGGTEGWEGSVYAVIRFGEAKPGPALILPKQSRGQDERTKVVATARIGVDEIDKLLAGRGVFLSLGEEKMELCRLDVDHMEQAEQGSATHVPAALSPGFAVRVKARAKAGSMGCFGAGEQSLPFDVEEHYDAQGWFRGLSASVTRYAWRADTLEFEWIEFALVRRDFPPVENVLF